MNNSTWHLVFVLFVMKMSMGLSYCNDDVDLIWFGEKKCDELIKSCIIERSKKEIETWQRIVVPSLNISSLTSKFMTKYFQSCYKSQVPYPITHVEVLDGEVYSASRHTLVIPHYLQQIQYFEKPQYQWADFSLISSSASCMRQWVTGRKPSHCTLDNSASWYLHAIEIKIVPVSTIF
jgi:hypothetical protein